MRQFNLRQLPVIMTVCLCHVLVVSEMLPGGEQRKALPKFSEIEQTVQSYFKTLPDYQPGDVISRSQVDRLLKQSRLFDWLGAERSTILGQVLPDDDFLVAELRTPEGREFLPQIAGYPDGFDRLDRLRRLDQGHKALSNVIRVRDGYKLIETLTTSSNGKALGKVLSKSPKGTDFNEPTGRIYTVEMLLARLKQSYRAKTAKTPAKRSDAQTATAPGGST